MFDVFGEFDTVEELNMAAEGLKNEGDTENLYKLAEENGIERAEAEMYQVGAIPMLCCDVATAAMGKIDVEAAELNPQEKILDWVNYIKGECFKNDDMARAVRRKGKNLKGCLGKLLAWSCNHSYKIHPDIVEAAGADFKKMVGAKGAQRVEVEECTPGEGTAKKLIKEYYLG